MNELIEVPKMRKYDSGGMRMTKSQQVEDLTNRVLKLYDKTNTKKEAKE